MKGEFRIGTSGWHYPHWRGPVYPENLPASDWLAWYAERFTAVEVNNTFYRLPQSSVVTAWRRETPDQFVFACKASRFITHMKKLKEPVASTRRFFGSIMGLGPKMGPILFQVPPRFRPDTARLEAFLRALPRRRSYAFEFRDPRWHTDAVCDVLSAHGAAFCLFDLAGFQTPPLVTSSLIYIRLHGPGGAYAGSYGDRALSFWAKRISGWSEQGHVIHCYFDNDDCGFAFHNARTLCRMLETGD